MMHRNNAVRYIEISWRTKFLHKLLHVPMNQSGTRYYEVKAPLLISAIMQILSSLRQIGGSDAIYSFFLRGNGEGASLASGIRKPRRTRTFQRRYGEYNAICNSPRCNADLPRRTDAGRPTRIIAKSRTHAAPARSSVRFTRAPLLSSIIYFPPPLFGEPSRDVVPRRVSVTIEHASRLWEAKLSVTGCPRSRAFPPRVPRQVHGRKSRVNVSRLLS